MFYLNSPEHASYIALGILIVVRGTCRIAAVTSIWDLVVPNRTNSKQSHVATSIIYHVRHKVLVREVSGGLITSCDKLWHKAAWDQYFFNCSENCSYFFMCSIRNSWPNSFFFFPNCSILKNDPWCKSKCWKSDKHHKATFSFVVIRSSTAPQWKYLKKRLFTEL